MSESLNPGQDRLLDEVRAKIFYLASDVELTSPPAAMLLRAVAESIDGSAVGAESVRAAVNGLTSHGVTHANGAAQSNGVTASNGVSAPIRYLAANGIRGLR